jgi:hypothetical protein
VLWSAVAFDYPPFFLEMGSDHEIICSYSTLDPKLDPFELRPLGCALREATAA